MKKIAYGLTCLILWVGLLTLISKTAKAEEAMGTITRVFDATTDAAQRVRISSEKMDSELDQNIRQQNAHVNAGQDADFYHNQDFARDSTTVLGYVNSNSGLRWGWKRGRLHIGSTVYRIAADSVALVDSRTTFLQIAPETPAIVADSTGFLTGYIPLWIIRTGRTTGTGLIVQDTDMRSWLFRATASAGGITPSDSGGSNFLLQDFDKDTSTTTGLTLGIRRGTYKTYASDTRIFQNAASTITLVTSSTNRIYLDRNGNIFTDTASPDTGFQPTDTAMLIREAITNASAIVSDSDRRAFLQFPGNMRIFTGTFAERTRFYGSLIRGKDWYFATDVETVFIANSASSWKDVSSGAAATNPSPRFQTATTTTVAITDANGGGATNSTVTLGPSTDTGISVYIVGEIGGLSGGGVDSSLIEIIDNNTNLARDSTEITSLVNSSVRYSSSFMFVTHYSETFILSSTYSGLGNNTLNARIFKLR